MKENQNNETNPNEDDGENGSREDTEKKCTIEEALEQSGSCGRFQIFLQILATYLVLVIAYTPSFSYFTLDDPPWRCVVHHNHNHSNNNNNDDSHSSSSFCLQTINSTQPVTFDADSKFFNMRCTLPRDEWEYTTSKGYSAVTEWDLVCNHASWNALCNAMVFIGGLFGAALCGNWSDRYGRRPVMLGTLSMNALSSIACTFHHPGSHMVHHRSLLLHHFTRILQTRRQHIQRVRALFTRRTPRHVVDNVRV